ncbi:hypothetical protein [Bacillus sp. J33]|uniref:hypothetical protein n=1 Tax=Bacillus sp. J33 TaxID=935836 RepID=UPI00047D4341|nr:hypothetical protein [Bacillus sp. J33]
MERIRPTEETRERNSVNKHIKAIIKDYFAYSTAAEKRNDFLWPLAISVIVFLGIGIIEPSGKKILDIILNINSISLSVLAILAGFNTTSLSVIAAANRDTLRALNQAGQDAQRSSVLKQLVTFFAYSILTQIIILIFGTLIVILSSNFSILYDLSPIKTPLIPSITLSIFGALWLTIILYSLFLSVRNVSILYRYILYLGRD